ncbi:5311_t:CDS:1, partial [Diversispora eburnea]
MPRNKKHLVNLVIKENNNFRNKNCSNQNTPYKSSVEDENIKIQVENFVAQVDLEKFWNWCHLNHEKPILPNRSGENCPRAANSFFQFKRFVARYTKEHKIRGHNNQTILSKSQSMLWSKISEEQRQFFKNLYEEALKFQKENYPEYAFHPKRQKSELKIKSMGKKSKDAVVEKNEYEQMFDLAPANRNNNLGAAHINKEEANILPNTNSYDFSDVNTAGPNSVLLDNGIPSISVVYVPMENESFTFSGASSPFTFNEISSPSPFASQFVYNDISSPSGSSFAFNDVSSPSSSSFAFTDVSSPSNSTSTTSTPIFSSPSPQMDGNSSGTSTISTPIFHSPNCNYFSDDQGN